MVVSNQKAPTKGDTFATHEIGEESLGVRRVSFLCSCDRWNIERERFSKHLETSQYSTRMPYCEYNYGGLCIIV